MAGRQAAPQALHPRLKSATRHSLLLGTALASTLLLVTLTAPTPAHAAFDCIVGPPAAPASPGPISQTNIPDAITCVNTETRTATGAGQSAIRLDTNTGATDRYIMLDNSGRLSAASRHGIYATTGSDRSFIDITNTGDIETGQQGVDAYTAASGNNSSIKIDNRGNIFGTGYNGLRARTKGANSKITIINSGDVTFTNGAYGIYARTYNVGADIYVSNRGKLSGIRTGIYALSVGSNIDIRVVNRGDIWATSTNQALGVSGASYGSGSTVSIFNSGELNVTGTNRAVGINATGLSDISVTNSADIQATSSQGRADGIFITSFGANAPTEVVNSGNVRATAGIYAFGIAASQFGANRPLTIRNSGSVFAEGPSNAPAGYIAGISVYSQSSSTTIFNTGDVSASSQLAISFNPNGGGTASVYNAGEISGYVVLTQQNDLFENQSGGVFELQSTTSLFGGGNDLFINRSGGTVQAASDRTMSETSAFQGLETFRNQGLISLQDGATGDIFTISNTPGGKNLDFVASGNSTLAVDAFLGGPGNSSSDTFTVQGNVSGVTTVQINNLNSAPGVYNPAGIKVVTVTGQTPTGNEFQLADPVSAGLFEYDLFFTPTGSGFWSLKSYPGASAHVLPQLVTAAQDIWHQGSSTWFDRTADLRVLLNRGAGAPAYGPNGAQPPPGTNTTPAVWARGSGSWLQRDDSQSTRAYGSTYTFNLDRDLQTMDFQAGLDMGKRDVLSRDDAFVFGVLGGFVQANLDYDQLVRQFDFSGGQVGAYATYVKGGLFVDTLANVHLYSIDTHGTLGFPGSLDASTFGLRTDTGYRFGGFRGGPFLEPLATIEVMWADIDGFSRGGNTVSFNDDPNVRGRLGLRAGTTMQAWAGTIMEPFVIASLWGNLSDQNQATLVSTGTTFRFEDNLQDVWGEVSGGVNLFNFSQTTAVFAKADVTFGNDITGVGGKAGMRVAW